MTYKFSAKQSKNRNSYIIGLDIGVIFNIPLHLPKRKVL
jgi:hypothetical protein